jgi:hypothetical protein
MSKPKCSCPTGMNPAVPKEPCPVHGSLPVFYEKLKAMTAPRPGLFAEWRMLYGSSRGRARRN